MVEVFSLILGMSIPWCGKIGKGKFPQSSLKAHFIFPSHGLAVMVKKNFPSRGFAAPGEIFVSPVAAPPLLGKLFFTNPAKPFLGKIKCAFRDSWGNFYFPFPIFPHHGIGPFPHGRWSPWWGKDLFRMVDGHQSEKTWVLAYRGDHTKFELSNWEWHIPTRWRNRNGFFPYE